MKGYLINKRYKYITIFLDYAPKLGYVYMRKTKNAIDTLEAKLAFQQHNMERGIIIKDYPADIEIFKAHSW